MRIVYIADADCNHGHRWITHFSKYNEAVLICHASNHLKYYTQNPEVKIYPILPDIYPLRNFLLRKKIISEIRKIIHEHRIQIVHSLYAVPFAFWAYHADFENYIVTTRGSDILVEYEKNFNNPKNLKEKIIFSLLKSLLEKSLRRAKYVTSTSHTQTEVIRKFVSHHENLHVIRTGVDGEYFLSIDKKTERESTETIIFSNRAMRKLYNIDLILDAFSLLKKKLHGRKLKLVQINYFSNSEYYLFIQNKINTDDVLKNNVSILPEQDFENLIRIYKNSDLVISIPSSDGTPVSAIEAMFAKKPLLISNINYDKDLFNENTVWKIDSFSPEDICNKILEIINLPGNMVSARTESAFHAAFEKADFKREMKKLEHLYKTMIPDAK